MTVDELVELLLSEDERLVAALCLMLDGKVHAGTADSTLAIPDDPTAAYEERVAAYRAVIDKQ